MSRRIAVILPVIVVYNMVIADLHGLWSAWYNMKYLSLCYGKKQEMTVCLKRKRLYIVRH